MSPEIATAVAPRLVASSLVSSADVGDPGASRTVYLTVIGLAVVAVALVAVGVWLIRQTRIDPELLAPLEEMETRRWRRTDPVGRRRLLDEVRPNGAVPRIRTPRRPEIDAEFGVASAGAVDFDDLADDRGVDVDGDRDGSPVGPAHEGGGGADALLRRPADPAADDGEIAGAEETVEGGDVADGSHDVDDAAEQEHDPEAGTDPDARGDDAAGGDSRVDGSHDADVDEHETGEGAGRNPLDDVEDLSSWPPPRIPGEGLLGREGSAEERSTGDR